MLLVFFTGAGSLFAQSWLSYFGVRPLQDTLPSEKSGFALIPLVYYTPDTDWAFGAAGVYYFNVKAKKEGEKDARLSYAQFLADYTLNNQWDFWGIWNVFTRNENFLIKGELRFRKFPDRFYGIGNTSSTNDLERYAYNLFSFKYYMLRRVGKATFVGADFSFTNEFGFTLEEGGQLEQGNITGYNGGRGSALGLVATHDTRDNVVNAHKGHFAEVSTYFYRKALGGTFNFNNYNLTYQNYYAVKRKHILAYQLIARINTGDVPFLDMSTVGGDVLIRGYARNRFRDNNFVGTQLEYRFPVYKRLGMVAFAAAGDVFSATSDVGFNTIKYSIGTGFRLLMNPGERLNVRFDIGVGREGMEYYLMVSEAF